MTSSTGIQNRRRELHAAGMKECCDCGVIKPLDEFVRIRRNCADGISGFTAACKPCRRIRDNKWRTDNRVHAQAKSRANYVARTYGLSLEQHNELYEKQRGCCAICGTHASELKRSLFVDHDHSTGKVRGLLCNGCNSALGYFRDCPENLHAAIAYLRATEGEK